jgi:hypothetical protein
VAGGRRRCSDGGSVGWRRITQPRASISSATAFWSRAGSALANAKRLIAGLPRMRKPAASTVAMYASVVWRSAVWRRV